MAGESEDRVAAVASADGDAVLAAANVAAASARDDYARLRELLLGDERRELAAAHARIAELERAQRELPRRLPDAAFEALHEHRDNPRVADALAAPVAQALGNAVHDNRQSIIDALFPIIGPMIRRAIAEALRGLVDNLNGAIESSFTARGLKWRVEAWRAGVPYAQVVLRHRLAYGIDHVFLVERDSGLVLRHVAAPGAAPLDADAIAGMLTALGDFVGDSVGGERGALDSAQVGDSLVWVEHGPRANLACFVRGVPSPRLRGLLEQRLEDIHAQILALPADAPLQTIGEEERVRELLDPMQMLREADADGSEGEAPQRAKSMKPVFAVALIALVALGWFVAERWRWHARVDALRDTLATRPGFVLGGIDERPWRSLVVHGLLDPDAPSPLPFIEQADLGKASRRLDATGFVSADDRVVLRRAQRLLQAPDGVTLDVKDGVLHLAGEAPQAWIDAAALRAPMIAGVARVESTVQVQIDPARVARAALDRALVELAARRIAFVREDEPVAGSDAVVEAIATDVRRAQAFAREAGVALDLRAVGSSDEGGGGGINAHVRELRARWLALALAARGIADVGDGDARANPDPTQRSARIQASIGGAR